MKVYGIARKVWDGYKYSSDYNDDIMLQEKKRNKDYEMLEVSVRISDIQYEKFETELNEKKE